MTRSRAGFLAMRAHPLLEQLRGTLCPGVCEDLQELAGQQLRLGARDECDLSRNHGNIIVASVLRLARSSQSSDDVVSCRLRRRDHLLPTRIRTGHVPRRDRHHS